MKTALKLLGLVVAGVLAAVVVLNVGAEPGEQRPAPTSPATSPPASEPTHVPSTRPDDVLEHDDHAGRPSAEAELVEQFAVRFGARVNQKRWLASLAPLVTPELLACFEYTAPETRPRGTVTAVVERHPVGDFEVTYSGGLRIRVTLSSVGGRWRVAEVEPVVAELPDGTDL